MKWFKRKDVDEGEGPSDAEARREAIVVRREAVAQKRAARMYREQRQESATPPHQVSLRGGPYDGRQMTITTKEISVYLETPSGSVSGDYVITDDPNVLTWQPEA